MADRIRSQGYEVQKSQEPGQCDASKPEREQEQENITDREPFSGLSRTDCVYFIPQENPTTDHLEEPKILSFIRCTV